MSITKTLIVNADDFGQSHGVNAGIIEAHENGVVTSASLMVRWPAAVEAAEYAKQHSELSIGLHLDLGEWAYRNGEWHKLYEVVREDDAVAVAKEVEQQLTAFRQLMKRNPTHLDSHQHPHRHEPIRSIALALAAQLCIPLRHFSSDVRFTGEFYGQTDEGLLYPDGISVNNLLRIIRELPPGNTELACHPAVGNDLETMYQTERELEVKTLCDARVKSTISDIGIELTSYHKFNGRVPSVV